MLRFKAVLFLALLGVLPAALSAAGGAADEKTASPAPVINPKS